MDIPSNKEIANLTLLLKEMLNLHTFVETGTYLGATTRWASNIFSKVYTIEKSEDLYKQTIKKCRDLKNVNFFHGDSRDILNAIEGLITTPAIFWLDAHWSGEGTYNQFDECPLLEEISIIDSSNIDHILLIDDARLFLSPPPRPHNPNKWPNITTIILNLIHKKSNRFIFIFYDVIVVIPECCKSMVIDYCQEINTKALNTKASYNLNTLQYSYTIVTNYFKKIFK